MILSDKLPVSYEAIQSDLTSNDVYRTKRGLLSLLILVQDGLCLKKYSSLLLRLIDTKSLPIKVYLNYLLGILNQESTYMLMINTTLKDLSVEKMYRPAVDLVSKIKEPTILEFLLPRIKEISRPFILTVLPYIYRASPSLFRDHNLEAILLKYLNLGGREQIVALCSIASIEYPILSLKEIEINLNSLIEEQLEERVERDQERGILALLTVLRNKTYKLKIEESSRGGESESSTDAEEIKSYDRIDYRIPLALIKGISHMMCKEHANDLPESLLRVIRSLLDCTKPEIVYMSAKILIEAGEADQRLINILLCHLSSYDDYYLNFLKLLDKCISQVHSYNNKTFCIRYYDSLEVKRLKISLLLKNPDDTTKRELEFLHINDLLLSVDTILSYFYYFSDKIDYVQKVFDIAFATSPEKTLCLMYKHIPTSLSLPIKINPPPKYLNFDELIKNEESKKTFREIYILSHYIDDVPEDYYDPFGDQIDDIIYFYFDLYKRGEIKATEVFKFFRKVESPENMEKIDAIQEYIRNCESNRMFLGCTENSTESDATGSSMFECGNIDQSFEKVNLKENPFVPEQIEQKSYPPPKTPRDINLLVEIDLNATRKNDSDVPPHSNMYTFEHNEFIATLYFGAEIHLKIQHTSFYSNLKIYLQDYKETPSTAEGFLLHTTPQLLNKKITFTLDNKKIKNYTISPKTLIVPLESTLPNFEKIFYSIKEYEILPHTQQLNYFSINNESISFSIGKSKFYGKIYPNELMVKSKDKQALKLIAELLQ